MHRRDFLRATLAGAAALTMPHARAATTTPQRLEIGSRTLEVNGRPASVFSVLGPDGRPGLTLDAGARFDVVVANGLPEETLIHWHGLTPPWDQDGVPGLPSPMIRAGEERAYDFPVGDGGTHWMHAHTLQEQNLLAAPLIVRTAADRASDEQEVVVLLHDFSFTPAEELLAGLLGGAGHGGAMGHGAMGHGMGHGMGQETAPAGAMDHGAMGGAVAMDLNDIEYDAYLANDRTLDDPEVHTVEKGGVVRLRIINGATSTAFTVELGRLEGELVAVDGQDVAPVRTSRIPLSMGQRADVRLRVPSEGGAFPVLFLREGARERTGIVLATPGARIARLATMGDLAGPVLGTEFEAMLSARRPLAVKAPDRSVMVHLTGDMASYRWAIAGAGDLVVRQGQRIEIAMMNMSMMAHPMHLHGHRFQVVGIDGHRMAGAVRDTVLIPPMRTVIVTVDADNPGRWAFHCHHLYHMASGMMAELAYEDVD